MDSYEKRDLIKRFIVIAILIAVLSAGTTYYFMMKSFYGGIKKESYSENSNENIQTIASNIKNFRQVIDRFYIGEIDEEKMLDETLKGYINGLDDEYSEYMTEEEWGDFQSNALGNYVGIGIYMSLDKNGNVVIVSPIKETPAEAAGLQSEDIIVEVDGESVIGESMDTVSNKIKGEPGSKVKIKVLRGEEYKDFEVERQAIKVYHVESKMLENNIGYIELITFDEGCAEEFKKAYEDLKGKGAQKLIVDLRYNTGGLVEEALSILNLIVPEEKTLLITLDSKENKQITKATGGDIINMEMVVLANEYSASASEIVVGALKDNDEATIVGTQTYGKGVIQNVYQLNDGSVLKLTVNEYYTPNEIKINKVGIEPDIVVELPEDAKEDVQLNKAIEVLNTME